MDGPLSLASIKLSNIESSFMSNDSIPEDQPFLSLVIPFEPKMNTDYGFKKVVSEAANRAEKELLEEYPEEKASPVIQKLKRILKTLDHRISNNSIGIFVSPLLEKVYYFTYDDTVDKKIQKEKSFTEFGDPQPQN